MTPIKVESGEAGESTAVAMFTGDAGSLYFDEALSSELVAVIGRLEGATSGDAICLGGPPHGFLRGADVRLFRSAIERQAVNEVVRFTERSHQVLHQLAKASKFTVAWVRGPAVGAGLEVALACHRIVAAPNTKFSMPETGLGIYPGMGGTQRLPRRIGAGLAKWMIYTGAIVPADHALAIGLADAVLPVDATPDEVVEAARAVPAASRRELPPRFATLEQLFANHTLAELLDPTFTPPADPQAVRALVQLRSKAPLALRLAEQIIDRGLALPLEAGLLEEISHLTEVFSSEDARVGLASIGQAAPKFLGR